MSAATGARSDARVRQALVAIAGGVLLAGPTALAFFSGGYFAGPRAWAGLGAWLLVALAAVVVPGALPRDRVAGLAIGALAGLAAWTLLSMLWAPITGDAYHAGQIVMLYLGALIAAAMLLRESSTQRWVEPALAAGALVVIGYGLSERLVPGLETFARSVSAEGRLEQPLTYWNAMGELAAIGLVLCARLAGDPRRPRGLRAAAAAAAAPLGLGLYISFSRGALFACAAGLIALIVIAPRREQLVGELVSVAAAVLAAAAAAPSAGVTGLAGSLAARERQGAITLVVLLVVMGAAAVAQRRLSGNPPAGDVDGKSGPPEPIRHQRGSSAAPLRPPRRTDQLRRPAGQLRLPRRAPLIATGLVCAGLALAIVVGARETSGAAAPLSGNANRLVTLQSNRYDYWDVALRAFASSPVYGVGAGGWSVDWLRWRAVNEFAHDAHSLELQTLAELGVIGEALLLACFAGIALAAARALAVTPAAAGPAAGLVVYLAHSPLDWDWQMPAVTLVAAILAGSLLGAAGDRPAPPGAGVPVGSSR